ncbi:MAG: hypothetical protein INR73_00570 [Williamsia sp.]|nr:hypothetical protein [Williamsia sp.]
MVDLNLLKTNGANREISVRGIETGPNQVTITAGTKMASIGFKLPAVEYLLGSSIKDVLNEGKYISNDFWQFKERLIFTILFPGSVRILQRNQTM